MVAAIGAELTPDDTPVLASEIVATRVAEEVVLVTYVSQSGGRPARRSSLWRRTENRRQLLFHQGTPAFEGS